MGNAGIPPGDLAVSSSGFSRRYASDETGPHLILSPPKPTAATRSSHLSRSFSPTTYLFRLSLISPPCARALAGRQSPTSPLPMKTSPDPSRHRMPHLRRRPISACAGGGEAASGCYRKSSHPDSCSYDRCRRDLLRPVSNSIVELTAVAQGPVGEDFAGVAALLRLRPPYLCACATVLPKER